MKIESIIFIIFIMLFSFNSFSENKYDKLNIWVTPGLGFYSASDMRQFDGLTRLVTLNYQNTNNTIIALHYINSNDMSFFESPDEYYNDFGLLYGFVHKSHWFNVSASTGISYFYGKYKTKKVIETSYIGETYESKKINTIGLPVKLNAFFCFTDYTGIGLEYNINVNNKKINQSISLCAQAGFGLR